MGSLMVDDVNRFFPKGGGNERTLLCVYKIYIKLDVLKKSIIFVCTHCIMCVYITLLRDSNLF